MSGGSYEYAYLAVQRFADALEIGPSGEGRDMKARRQFVIHLRDVAVAMRTVEWVDSGDMSPPRDADAIWRVLK